MSRLVVSPNSRFIAITVVTLISFVAVLAVAYRPVTTLMHQTAAKQAQAAQNSSNSLLAIGRYRLALTLDRHNADYRVRLSTLYLDNGYRSLALDVLGNTSMERQRKATILVQEERYDDALKAIDGADGAEQLQNEIELEQGRGAIEKVLPDAPDDPLTRAQLLYQKRLYRSTERELAKASDSSAKARLLVSTLLARPKSDERLTQARTVTETALKLDPGDIRLHELLRDIASRQRDSQVVERENRLLEKLHSGAI